MTAHFLGRVCASVVLRPAPRSRIRKALQARFRPRRAAPPRADRKPQAHHGKSHRYGRAASSGSYVQNDPVNATDPTGMECNASGNRVTCRPDVAGAPSVTFPRPQGWPDRIAPGTPNYHDYNVPVSTSAPASRQDAVEAGLINNPTPGPDRPASPTGTLNDAAPVPTPDTDYVRSYSAPISGQPGRDVVINVTTNDHILKHGYVMRWTTVAPDGTVTVNNAGEGNSPYQQNGLGRIWRPQVRDAWTDNVREIVP